MLDVNHCLIRIRTHAPDMSDDEFQLATKKMSSRASALIAVANNHPLRRIVLPAILMPPLIELKKQSMDRPSETQQIIDDIMRSLQ